MLTYFKPPPTTQKQVPILFTKSFIMYIDKDVPAYHYRIANSKVISLEI